MGIVEAGLLFFAAANAGVSAVEQKKATRDQIKAQKDLQAKQQILFAEQQAGEERTRVRDIQRTSRRRRAGADPGLRSTVLTGPSGISTSAPGTEGGKTLLGL